MFFVYFPEQCIVGRPFYSKENASALNFAVQKDDTFVTYSTSLFFPPVLVFCAFSLNRVLPEGPSTVRKMRPPRISRFKRTINLPRTVPLCFSLLYMFFVSFLEQFVARRPFVILLKNSGY